MIKWIWRFVSVVCINAAVASETTVTSPWVWHDAEQHTVSAASFAHHWVFINYWAAWCRLCGMEVPELNAFFEKHKAQGVLVYGVNYDALTGVSLQRAVAHMGIVYPVLAEN